MPAFPLDGGRALRAALWHWRGDYRTATRQAAQMGSTFGLFLIAVGILNFIGGNVVGGMWWCLIGLFMRGAAGASVYQLATRKALGRRDGRGFMSTPVIGAADLTLDRFVEDYVYVHHHDFFPVVDGDRPMGGLTTRQVAAVPRDAWCQVQAGDVMIPVDRDEHDRTRCRRDPRPVVDAVNRQQPPDGGSERAAGRHHIVEGPVEVLRPEGRPGGHGLNVRPCRLSPVRRSRTRNLHAVAVTFAVSLSSPQASSIAKSISVANHRLPRRPGEIDAVSSGSAPRVER